MKRFGVVDTAASHELETQASSSKPQSQESVSTKRIQPPREDVTALVLGVGVSFILTLVVKAFEYRLHDVLHEPNIGCPTEKVKVCKTNLSWWFRVDPP